MLFALMVLAAVIRAAGDCVARMASSTLTKPG